MKTIIINGNPQQYIAASDRGLAYGDGLFETIACVNGRLQYFSQHMQRLQKGCERLLLPIITEQQWLDDIRQLAIGEQPMVIKLMLTRGSGGRGYNMPPAIQTTRIVSLHPWPDYSPQLKTQGGRLVVCKTPISTNPALGGLKHLNRLDNVLARAEWDDADIIDGLMLDAQGHVVEGTMSNIFAVDNNGIYTPPISQAGVEGVMRQQVILLAKKLAYSCEQVPLSIIHLMNMDEVFITNSLLGICPIRQLADTQFSHWPVIETLQKQLHMDGESFVI